MSEFWVELSLENLALARAELEGATRALEGSGRLPDPIHPLPPEVVALDLGRRETAIALAGRLALGRRVLEPWPEDTLPEVGARFEREGSTGATAALRPFGRPRSRLGEGALDRAAEAYRAGGGRIDLNEPARRFFLWRESESRLRVCEERAVVDRNSFARRRMPTLPFRRPVSLPPKLGRVAVNLAAVRPGDHVIDPFVGTGALLVEAALVGGRVSGVDRDAAMIRGAIQNFAHLGLEFASLRVGDAEEAARQYRGEPLDALVTDPPYGRSSGSAGEVPEELLQRTLPRWGERIRPGGRMVVVLPGGPDPVGPPWVRVASVPDRVHRSLTREFRVYERAGQ